MRHTPAIIRPFGNRRRPPAVATEAELVREYGPLKDVPLRALAAPKPPKAPVAPMVSATVSDFTPFFWAGRRLTPDQIRTTLEGAVGGNFQVQWFLFDLMEDTWPRLAKNLAEIRRAAARATYSVQPYAARGQKPTDTARARADVVEAALRNWQPKPGTLERGLEDALFDALDAMGKGMSVLEVSWQQTPSGTLPRCAHFVAASKYAWNEDGSELGLSGGGTVGFQPTWQPFPPGQFLIGSWAARSGAPGQTALLRCLAPYWVGITFGWEWLLSNAQIFGVPFRWATYDANHPELLTTLQTMLTNLGSAGWAAFPAGTQMEFKEAVSRASDNPQVYIQTLADQYCDQLILGQDASGQTRSMGMGGGAAFLHQEVRDQRIQDAAKWCADLLNYQLVPYLLQWNFGDQEEPPTVVPDFVTETDPKAMADRDQVLATMGLRLPARYLYTRHAIPEPEDGEETVGGSGSVPPPESGLPLAGPGRSSESPAPGMPSDAGSPETGAQDPQNPGAMPETPGSRQTRNPDQANGKIAGRASTPLESHSPESAVGFCATKNAVASVRAASSGKSAQPDGYQMPEKTREALTAAYARDLAPLRKAAEPLLASIEAGKLEVVGELEAFIARLDAMAPQMVGASALADALEAALAEASIAGSAGTYRKLPHASDPSLPSS